MHADMCAGYEAGEAGRMFDMIDTDHGGTVSLDEFAAWWLSDSHTGQSSGGVAAERAASPGAEGVAGAV